MRDATAARLGTELARLDKSTGKFSTALEIYAWLDEQADSEAVTGWGRIACLEGYRAERLNNTD